MPNPDAVENEVRMLGAALSLAARVHRTQRDKQGHPYLAHPLRVAARVLDACDGDLTAATVGLLHDVMEDSAAPEAAGPPVDLIDLEALRFGAAVCGAVDLLTHRVVDSYDEFIASVAARCQPSFTPVTNPPSGLSDRPPDRFRSADSVVYTTA
jgi:hypothetical protein